MSVIELFRHSELFLGLTPDQVEQVAALGKEATYNAGDIVITQLTRKSPARFKHGPDRNMTIQHHGKKESWGSIPTNVTHWQPAADGSAIIGDGERWLAIDFSGASGADVGGLP